MRPDSHVVLNTRRVLDALSGGFRKLRILVVGDLMLDRYLIGDVERISPEAPVPVLRQIRQYARPGGAANVALNLAGLGVEVSLCGLVGADPDGRELVQQLEESGVRTEGVLPCGLPTITKTRVVSRTQQLLRVDVESRSPGPMPELIALQAQALEAAASADAVILSDYAKGVLTEQLCQAVIGGARQRGIPVLVDPKARDFQRYAGATTICPNLKELSAAAGMPATDLNSLLPAAQEMVRSLGLDFLTVTMSERGIVVLQRDGTQIRSDAKAREVFDVSGAGDTVIATLAASIASGLDLASAIELANLAAGIVVGKVGTVPVTAAEIVGRLTYSTALTSAQKVLDRARAVALVQDWQAAGETIVFTNGCFDLLHVGHITLLEQCRRFGSKLVVAINTDASVQRLKGPTRPIVGEGERAKVLAALAAVDLVTHFDEPTPLELIQQMRPGVLVKGGDYSVSTVVGHETVAAYGGRVEIVPIVEGFSTTRIVQKMTAGEA